LDSSGGLGEPRLGVGTGGGGGNGEKNLYTPSFGPKDKKGPIKDLSLPKAIPHNLTLRKTLEKGRIGVNILAVLLACPGTLLGYRVHGCIT